MSLERGVNVRVQHEHNKSASTVKAMVVVSAWGCTGMDGHKRRMRPPCSAKCKPNLTVLPRHALLRSPSPDKSTDVLHFTLHPQKHSAPGKENQQLYVTPHEVGRSPRLHPGHLKPCPPCSSPRGYLDACASTQVTWFIC